jgi:hypothetical protein
MMEIPSVNLAIKKATSTLTRKSYTEIKPRKHYKHDKGK